MAAVSFDGADLRSAFIADADMTYADDLTQDQLERARGDGGTILPEGLTRPKAWPDFDPGGPGWKRPPR